MPHETKLSGHEDEQLECQTGGFQILHKACYALATSSYTPRKGITTAFSDSLWYKKILLILTSEAKAIHWVEVIEKENSGKNGGMIIP